MRVELINTGTEILLGVVQNSHLAYLAEAIFPLGLTIARQTTVPDGDDIQLALRESALRSDIIFITGGLGPTDDDCTRTAAASVMASELQLDEELLADLRERFARRGLPINDHIARQAMVPVGAEVLPNPHGTAPGLFFPPQPDRPALFLLPGPPRELRPMVTEHVLPKLAAIVPDHELSCTTVKLTGIGESQVEEQIGETAALLDNLEIGYCARQGEVDVRLIGESQVVAEVVELLRQKMAEFIFSEDGRSLEEVVVHRMQESGQMLAIAESCTGGFLSHRITNVPGASKVLAGAITPYANEIKCDLLGVEPATIDEFGAVSLQVAMAMAAAARLRFGCDYALATTGIAGPTGGTDSKPVGTLFIGLADQQEAISVQRYFRTDRQSFKQMASQSALDLLRRKLAGLPLPH